MQMVATLSVPAVALAFVLFLAGCVPADFSKSELVPGPMPESIDRLMQRYHGDGPGASLLVLRDGHPVLRRSYGMAEVESGIAATPASNYRLASVSKQFTAAAVLLLAQEGRLGLEDPVRKWLPTLPVATDEINVRHLLTHTSGLIDYEEVMPDEPDRQLRDVDVLHILEHQHWTYFAPDSDYRYSNSGYALLALIVERVSGNDYPDFLRERIFQPLGMEHTLAYVQGAAEISHRAYGYSQVGAQWQLTDHSATSAVLGDGGIYSSIDDLAKWDAALYDDRLLAETSRQMAFKSWTNTRDPAVDYGLGWRITGDSVWHSGETIGFRNVIVRYPAQRLTVVILSNRNEPEPYQTALQIAALFQR